MVTRRRARNRRRRAGAATSTLCVLALSLTFSAGVGLAEVREAAGGTPLDQPLTVETHQGTSGAPAGDVAADGAATPDAVAEELPDARTPQSPCAEALTWVAEAGLPLPADVDYQCPSTQFAHQGAACWNNSVCPQRGLVAINMDRLSGASVPYLHHVVAHEICHILEFQAQGWSTEDGADSCAADHGAPS